MKLVVQVPCLNEEETLPSVLQSIPRAIEGIDEIVIVVIDDGSTDRTVEVARSLGVTHFVRHARNQGLARSFQDGVDYALDRGRHRRQHRRRQPVPTGPDPRPGPPVVEGRADIVIADRQVHLVEHFSPAKKALQRLGSRVVNRAAGTDLPDAASGFRAYSRESLMRLNMVTRFSYCMESIIQAGNKRLRIESVPVVTNAKTRESRLFTSTRQHVFKSAAAIVRAYIMYKPYVIFGWVSAILALLGLVPFVRYAVLVAMGEGGGHLPVPHRRRRAADPGLPERDARHHLRPDPHQPDPGRGKPGAHQEGQVRAGQRCAGRPATGGCGS